MFAKLLVLCGLAALTTVFVAVDELGFHGPPWFGWWDSNITITAPYTVTIRPRADGAAARGGLENGDRIDLRRQTLNARVAMLFQLMAERPTVLNVDRGRSTRTLTIFGSTVWNNATFWKLQPMISRSVANAWFTLCALAIVWCRWRLREARIIAVALICIVGKMLDPSFAVVPSGITALVLLLVSRGCGAAASILLVQLSAQSGAHPDWRRALERTAYAVISAGFLTDVAAAFGLLTTWIDPLPYILSLSPWRGYLDVICSLFVVLAAATAVKETPGERKPQTAYLLLPLPIGLLCSAALFAAPVFITSWFTNIAIIGIANAAIFLGVFIVTYALLKSRATLPALMCAVLLATLVPQGSSAQPAKTVDHQHDFDFEFGNWQADLKVLQHPFTGSHTYVDFRGTSVVKRIWNGRANYGELEVGNATTHIEGLTLRLYDPRVHEWHIYFSNSANGGLGLPPMVGHFTKGRGEFYDTETIDGKTTRVRFVFSDITRNTFHFEQSFSIDGGKTWERDWISTFTRSPSM
jgi:hypothetical protein